MSFQFKPDSRVQNVAGRIAVGAFFIVAYLTVTGCSGGDQKRAQRAPERVATPPVQVEPTVRPASIVTETPAAEPERIAPENVKYEDAEAAFRDKRYGEAVDLFRIYTEKHADNVWGHYMLGLSARRSGNAELAEREFDTALEIDPRHVKSLINLSRVFLGSDRPDEALDKLEQVLDVDPESSDAFRLRGVALTDLGRVDEAIESYREAILLDGKDAWSINNLGLVLIRLGRFDEALPALARATQLRADVAVFQNNLGVALEGTGYPTAAADAFRTTLALDPGYDKAAVSLDHIESLDKGADEVAVDLTQLARQFMEEIELWRDGGNQFPSDVPLVPEVESGLSEPTETFESSELVARDTTVVPEADTVKQVEADTSTKVKPDSTNSN
ncbi:MAG: tetratricopeptide repeat protein [Gemmatimonadales bacterium]